MNRNSIALLVALAGLTGAAGCKKDTAAKTTSSHYISASSGSIGSFYASGAEVGAAGAAGAKIEMYGTEASGRRVNIYINPYAGTVGVVPVTYAHNGGVYSSPLSDTVISSVTGNITLTSVTPDLIGTFSYAASDGSTFTGAFNVAAP